MFWWQQGLVFLLALFHHPQMDLPAWWNTLCGTVAAVIEWNCVPVQQLFWPTDRIKNSISFKIKHRIYKLNFFFLQNLKYKLPLLMEDLSRWHISRCFRGLKVGRNQRTWWKTRPRDHKPSYMPMQGSNLGCNGERLNIRQRKCL